MTRHGNPFQGFTSASAAVCHASDVLGHLGFHFGEQGEGLEGRTRCLPDYSVTATENTVFGIWLAKLSFPQLPSMFSFTVIKQYSQKRTFC